MKKIVEEHLKRERTLSTLEILKKMIDDHFKKEMDIAEAILSAELSCEEHEELRNFIKEHEWSKFQEWLKSGGRIDNRDPKENSS